MNKLLQRQLQKYFGEMDKLPENFVELLYVISESYDHFEKDRKLIERSIDISSREMIELNNELNVEKEELKKAHNELNKLFTNIEEVFFSISFPDHSLLQMSPACEKIYGLPSEAFEQNSHLWYDVVLNEDKKNIDVNYPIMLAGKSFVQEYRIHHKDGSIRWLETKISPSLDVDGKLIRIDGVTADITKRKIAEEKLKRNELTLRQAQEIAHIGSWKYDFASKTAVWSEEQCRIFGVSPDENLQTQNSFLSFIHPEDLDFVKNEMQKALDGLSDNSYYNRIVRKDGTVRYIYTETRNEYDTEGELLGKFGIMQDVTEQKLAEIQKEFDRNNLSSLINNTNDLLWSVDTDFKLITSNIAFDGMVKFLSGKSISQGSNIFDEGFTKEQLARYKGFYERAFSGEIFTILEYTDLPTEFWSEISFYPIRNGNDIIGTACYSRDITESKKSEKKILDMNKQLQQFSSHLQNILEEERTRIAREIHDELGQVIAVLKMDIGWVMHKQNKAEKEVVSKLNEMLQFSDGIINTVRRISTELRPAIIDDLGLIASLEWKCSNFEETMGIPCKFISCVKERKFENNFSITVFRILQETLTNVTRHADAKSVVVSVKEKDADLIMQIIDDGTGIDNEHFDKCKTLGILGMKERAGLLGGDIVIRGEKNKGTRTKLILPF